MSMNGTEMATVQNIEQAVVPIPSVIEQVAYIQNIMQSVMQKDQHYGLIPGTPKPSLWKPGAEKLCVSFRLDPEYEDLNSIERDDLILKEIKCTLYHIPSGNRIASGVGSANSREDKWRYRKVSTNEPVPGSYWDAKKKNDVTKMRELIGADGSPKKVDGQWVISRRLENDNPWNLHNTICKMASKRALVAAVLNATAASDIFTQDLEDLKDILPDETPEPAPEKKPAVKKPAAKKPAAERTPLKATTKGGAAIKDYDEAVELFKELKFGKESAHNFICNLVGSEAEGSESPLYNVVNQAEMEAVINELLEMKTDAAIAEAKDAGEDGTPLPLDG